MFQFNRFQYFIKASKSICTKPLQKKNTINKMFLYDMFKTQDSLTHLRKTKHNRKYVSLPLVCFKTPEHFPNV